MTEPALAEQRKPFDRHAAINRVLDTVDELVQVRNVSTPEWNDDQQRTVRHNVTLPALLDSLQQAVTPGADNSQAGGSKEFESKPAAKLHPMDVYNTIDREARWFGDLYDLRRHTLKGYLTALKAHAGQLDDPALRELDRYATTWRRDARLATNYDPMPITLSDVCPSCFRKNSLVITGDHIDCTASCTRCKTHWPHDMVGLLGQMLEQSRTQETLAAPTEEAS